MVKNRVNKKVGSTNKTKTMTNLEEKEIIRVCGENYSQSDIPTYIRNRDKKETKQDLHKLGQVLGLEK